MAARCGCLGDFWKRTLPSLPNLHTLYASHITVFGAAGLAREGNGDEKGFKWV